MEKILKDNIRVNACNFASINTYWFIFIYLETNEKNETVLL